MAALAALAAIAAIRCDAGSLPEQGRTGRYRIVFLGDSIIEGHTLPLLFQQALQEAGHPVPLCFNVGVGGDNAAGMRARLERDVLPFRPDLVVFSSGINDMRAGRSGDQYADDVKAIINRLKRDDIAVVLLTTTALTGPKKPANETMGPINEAIRQLGEGFGCPVAEVYEPFQQAVAAGVRTTEADDCHLNFNGYRIMTRALLDALGHAGVPVPLTQKLTPLPGLIQAWKIRARGVGEEPLTVETVAAVKPDARWIDYVLPEVEPIGHWWRDQERLRGVAMQAGIRLGKAEHVIGRAELDEPVARQAYLNTGSGLAAAWLNGEQVYRQGKAGWTLGRERIPVRLHAGRNLVIIEGGAEFFVSITEGPDW